MGPPLTCKFCVFIRNLTNCLRVWQPSRQNKIKRNVKRACFLQMVIVTVWITSAVYSTPKFVFSKTIKNIHTQDGQEEEICVLDREMFNSKLLDMINFVLLYVMPLLVMTVSECISDFLLSEYKKKWIIFYNWKAFTKIENKINLY